MVEKVTSNIILQPRKKNYNAMIDGRYFFDQPIKSDLKSHDKIRKIVTSQGDDYTTGC